MGLLDNIRGAAGKNSWPPQSVKSRWELIEGYAALRESNPAYVRAMAASQGMGGGSNSYITTPWARRLSLTAAHMILGDEPRIIAADPLDQARIQQLIQLNDFNARARAAAYVSSSEGGIYGKVSSSPNSPRSRKGPTLQFVSERKVIPHFANVDELVSATIVQEWCNDEHSRTIYRLLEHHEPGVIRYELYQGSQTDMGARLALAADGRTAGLMDEQATGIEELLITYIPNDRTVDSPFGVSDYRGLETLFLALNETATSAEDQQRLLKKRLIMDESLQTQGEFVDEDIVWVNQRHTADGSSPILQPTPGDWQAGQHVEWQNALLDLTLTLAGVSPQTLGRDLNGGASSGVALKLKMAHTASVMSAKAQQFERGIAEMFSLACKLDSMTIGSGINMMPAVKWANLTDPISVELQDNLPVDETEVADVVTKARAAGVMSRREALVRLNPQWDGAQLDEEEARLDQEAAQQQNSINTAASDAVASLPTLTLPPLNG